MTDDYPPEPTPEQIIASLQRELEEVKRAWRCFHCNEVFETKEQAETHFGATECSPTACQIDGEQLRDLEKQLNEYRNEDTALHRQIASMESQHQQSLMRVEESGYAKGLKDYSKVEQECDQLKSQLAASEAKVERMKEWIKMFAVPSDRLLEQDNLLSEPPSTSLELYHKERNKKELGEVEFLDSLL